MRVQRRLRRLDRFMTEPQRDHGAVDACLQKLHRRAVPQHVRRHPLRLNDGRLSPATCTCFAGSDWTLSALRRPPCMLGNKAIPPFRTGVPRPDYSDPSGPYRRQCEAYGDFAIPVDRS
jgi:hypothetical protein